MTSWWHLQGLLLRYLKDKFLYTNWTRYVWRFSFVFELCCLCKGFKVYLKRIFKNLHYENKKKSKTFIKFGNDETQAQKSLIPTQKANRFDHKRYKGRRILKFEFVFTVNNGDCDARWSMSFCLPTFMDNLPGMNQTKYLIIPTIMIITIIRIKNRARKWTPSLIINSLTHVCVSGGNKFLKFFKLS